MTICKDFSPFHAWQDPLLPCFLLQVAFASSIYLWGPFPRVYTALCTVPTQPPFLLRADNTRVRENGSKKWGNKNKNIFR